MRRRSGGIFALVLGAAAGFAAGLLVAPKSGKETREDLKEYAGEFGEQAEKAYRKASITVHEKLTALRKVGKKIDKKKYMKLVDEVVAEFKTDGTVTREAAISIGEQLGTDWKKVSKAVMTSHKAPKKPVTKKAKK